MVDIFFPDIDLKDVRGVLIDLDDTIYSYKKSHQKALIKCFDLYKDQIDSSMTFSNFELDYRKFRDIVTANLSPLASCRSRLLAFQLWFEDLAIKNPYSRALEFEGYYWDSLLKAIEPSAKAVEFLMECHRSQIPICIVTDMTTQQQIQKIQKLNIEQYISALVTSEEVGIEKPDPKMFELALEKIKVKATDAIMIGDHLEKDILSAEKVGLKTYRVTH